MRTNTRGLIENNKNIIPQFLDFIGDYVLVAHNASFDMGFLQAKAYNIGREIGNSVIDTLSLTRKLFPNISNHKLTTVANYLNIHMAHAHRSLCDATATAKILIKCISLLDKQDVEKDRERKLAKEAAKVMENL